MQLTAFYLLGKDDYLKAVEQDISGLEGPDEPCG